MGLSWTVSAGVLESTAHGKCRSATGVESMVCKMVMVGHINRIDVTGRLCISHLSGIDDVCEVAVGCVDRIDRPFGLRIGH